MFDWTALQVVRTSFLGPRSRFYPPPPPALEHSHTEIQRGPQHAVAFVGVQSIGGSLTFFRPTCFNRRDSVTKLFHQKKTLTNPGSDVVLEELCEENQLLRETNSPSLCVQRFFTSFNLSVQLSSRSSR